MVVPGSCNYAVAGRNTRVDWSRVPGVLAHSYSPVSKISDPEGRATFGSMTVKEREREGGRARDFLQGKK